MCGAEIYYKAKDGKTACVSLVNWRKRGIEDWGIVVDKEVPVMKKNDYLKIVILSIEYLR